MFSLKSIATTAVVATLVLSGLYYYNYYMQNKIVNLEKLTTQLTIQLDSKNLELLTIKADTALLRTQLVSVNNRYSDIVAQNSLLVNKLAEHDLEYLAINKPVLVQNIVNDATAKSNRCLEIMSGSPLTNKEKEAINATAFNSECPWLFIPK